MSNYISSGSDYDPDEYKKGSYIATNNVPDEPKMKQEKKAIDKWLTQLSGTTFSDNYQLEDWARETISQLVEDIYKEELKISDDRYKECEDKLKKYYDREI